MPPRDIIHDIVKQALVREGWQITDDPYIISYGERFLFVDLGAVWKSSLEPSSGQLLGAERAGTRIAVEVKEFRGRSPIVELEQALGQYVLYRLLLDQVDPERLLYLAITTFVYDQLFQEPVGELIIRELPLQLLVVDVTRQEVQQWIPSRPTEPS